MVRASDSTSSGAKGSSDSTPILCPQIVCPTNLSRKTLLIKKSVIDDLRQHMKICRFANFRTSTLFFNRQVTETRENAKGKLKEEEKRKWDETQRERTEQKAYSGCPRGHPGTIDMN